MYTLLRRRDYSINDVLEHDITLLIFFCFFLIGTFTSSCLILDNKMKMITERLEHFSRNSRIGNRRGLDIVQKSFELKSRYHFLVDL